jgi:DNA repair exonuclease SbcCD nuclease subunit
MKFMVCGDLHITDKMPYSSKQNDRSKELEAAWGEVCKAARKESIEHIIIVGDVFDDISVSPKAFATFSKMMEMSKGIHKIMVAGNHEIDEEGNALIKELGDYEKDLAITCPLPKHKSRCFPISDDADLLMFDYHHSYTDLKVSIRDTLRKSKAAYKIFVGHQPVEGMEMRDAMICSHGIPKVWFKKNGIIAKNFDMVLMGDFHRMQILKGDVEGYYTGSLIEHSFRDEGGDASFLIVNLDGEYSAEVKFEYTNSPKFHTVRFIEGKLEPDLRRLTKGGYVKIIVIGMQEYVDSIDLEEIRKEIIEKYSPISMITSNPTITCSIPRPEEMAVSRLMNDEELVEKIISTDKSKLPDKLRYDVGIKYLRRARE